MTALEDMLYRMGAAQRANDFKSVDGFGCAYSEVDLVMELYWKGRIYWPRKEQLMDGVLFNGVALTKSGVREWMRLHRMRADPSGK